jgi:hypothetical protein
VTTSLNTGYIESASILVSLGAVLRSLQSNIDLWPQHTGITEIDARKLSTEPRLILVCAGSDVGMYYAALIKKWTGA